VPDLMKNFQDYGMRFYQRATSLNSLEDKSKCNSLEFQDAIEAYFKFLACYEDKGEADTLTENVDKKLEACLSDIWLIRKKKKSESREP
jgi:hypothetical protein